MNSEELTVAVNDLCMVVNMDHGDMAPMTDDEVQEMDGIVAGTWLDNRNFSVIQDEKGMFHGIQYVSVPSTRDDDGGVDEITLAKDCRTFDLALGPVLHEILNDHLRNYQAMLDEKKNGRFP